MKIDPYSNKEKYLEWKEESKESNLKGSTILRSFPRRVYENACLIFYLSLYKHPKVYMGKSYRYFIGEQDLTNPTLDVVSRIDGHPYPILEFITDV